MTNPTGNEIAEPQAKGILPKVRVTQKDDRTEVFPSS